MTPTTRTKLITIGIVVSGTILALGDKVTKLPIPGWATSAWPFVYGGAILFDRIAHILWPDVVTSTQTATLSVSTTGATPAPVNTLMQNPPVAGPFNPSKP